MLGQVRPLVVSTTLAGEREGEMKGKGNKIGKQISRPYTDLGLLVASPLIQPESASVTILGL